MYLPNKLKITRMRHRRPRAHSQMGVICEPHSSISTVELAHCQQYNYFWDSRLYSSKRYWFNHKPILICWCCYIWIRYGARTTIYQWFACQIRLTELVSISFERCVADVFWIRSKCYFRSTANFLFCVLILFCFYYLRRFWDWVVGKLQFNLGPTRKWIQATLRKTFIKNA